MATNSVSHTRTVDVGSFGYEDGDRMPIDDGPTPESIVAAKYAQLRDREEVFRATGLLIRDGGLNVPSEIPGCIAHCPRCEFKVWRTTAGEAMLVLSRHFGSTHLPPHLRQRPQGMAS